MEGYIDTFLSGCDDPERQLAVMMGFSTLTNQGKPVLLSTSRVVRHLQAVALQKYICWLKDMFLRPDLDCCLDFSSNRQKQNRENADMWVHGYCTFLSAFAGSLAVSWQLFIASVSESLAPASDSFAGTKFNPANLASIVKTSQPAQSRLDHQKSFFSSFSSPDVCFGEYVPWFPLSLQLLRSL